MLQEREDLVEGTIIKITGELRQLNHVVLVVRSCLLAEVDVDNFSDRPSQVREIFDVSTFFRHRALTAKVALEHLHLRVKSHTNLLDERPFLVSEKDQFVALCQLVEENTETRSLYHLKADAKLIL